MEGVKFINEILGKDPQASIYIHCKAGRTRSATLVGGNEFSLEIKTLIFSIIQVACYLMSKHNWNPHESVNFIKTRRPHIRLHSKQLGSIDTFYNQAVLKI